MDDDTLLKKIKKIVHGNMPDHFMSDSMLAEPREIMQLIKQDRELTAIKLHKLADRSIGITRKDIHNVANQLSTTSEVGNCNLAGEAQDVIDEEPAKALMLSDLSWCLGKLRGLGCPAEHLESKYGLQF